MARESDTEERAIREHNQQVAQLGSRLANLTERDNWPYGKASCREFIEAIDKLSGVDRLALIEWEHEAAVSEDLSEGGPIWDSCPKAFYDLLPIGEDAPTGVDESDAMSPADLIERACAAVANYVKWKSCGGWFTDTFEDIVEHASSGELMELVEWATDVVKTNESGTELTANGGTLLKSIPKPLEHFFDVASLDGKSTDASLPPKAESLPDKPSRSREETKAVLEEQVNNALERLDAALLDHAGKDKAAKAAKKIADEAQEVLNAMVRVLRDFNAGGEYQQCLPFPAESDAATASPSGAAKPGTTPGNADEVAGWHVSVLTTKQLLQATNGQSEGAGITDANVDALVDADLGTIGLLESHMKKHGEFWFRNGLKGIGESKACKIAEALGCLRACYPVDTEPLDELILDDDAYQRGAQYQREGGDRMLPDGWKETSHQGRSWLDGYDDAASTEGGA